MAQIFVEKVTKEFPTRGEPLVVLREVSLALSAGENLAILGPSGSGKSTLLNILGTLEPPSSGLVVLDGVDPARLDARQLAQLRGEKIGLVFQEHYLLPQCSTLENVLVPAVARGTISNETCCRAKRLLERVGLGDRLEHRPAELSGGQRQRVALARALVNRPLLLLADEPTGNLDRGMAGQVVDLMLELQREEGLILIVVTHSQQVAGRMARRMELNDGRLLPAG